MEFEEIVKYIYDIPKFAGKNSLKETAAILGNVYNGKAKIIHVAGTNGKGSVCSYLSSILQCAGYRVGLFVSPHLVDIRERISINGEYISKEEFIDEFEVVKEAYQASGASHPSFFEYLFLMGMSYFGRQKPDYIILETGLGGRLDATNSVSTKDLTIITEIGFDHMQYLGNTIEGIAGEKAGIIIEGCPVVFADKRAQSTAVIKERAEVCKAKCIMLDTGNIKNIYSEGDSITFSFLDEIYQLETTALYQCENSALAILAAKELGIDKKIISEGLKKAFWPGRMEKVAEGVYIDGAHNEDGIEAFLNTVKTRKILGRRYLLFGMVNDKAYEKVIAMIAGAGLFDEIFVTSLHTDRTIDINEYMRIWKKYDVSLHYFDNVKDAWDKIGALQGKFDEIYVAGSLYMIGEIKEVINATKM